MTDLEKKFKNAIEEIKAPKSAKGKSVSNMNKLKLYAFFKQATEGPCQDKPPSKLNLSARAKFDFWKELKDTSKESAMQSYIDLVEKLFPGFEKYYTDEPTPKL